MTLVASDIIDQARGRSALFDVSRHPNKVVLQFLSSYAKELHGKVALVDPDILRSDVSAALPLDDHAAGFDLGTTRIVAGAVAVDSAGLETPIDVIPAASRNDRGVRVASGWQIGSRFYLTNPASLWTQMVSVKVAIVLLPTPLTLMNSTITLPDAAERALVEACAAFMAARTPVEPGKPTVNVREVMQASKDAKEEFLTDIANRLTGQVVQTRDVYP